MNKIDEIKKDLECYQDKGLCTQRIVENVPYLLELLHKAESDASYFRMCNNDLLKSNLEKGDEIEKLKLMSEKLLAVAKQAAYVYIDTRDQMNTATFAQNTLDELYKLYGLYGIGAA
jgi:hypothetical protein